ncbi:MAG: COX15/CtaA family protein [Alphaproteobacteria bacterium]
MTSKPFTFWLFACCGLIFAVVMVGAVTRLTGSGLSITEWNVLMGAIPPLSREAWIHAFDLYRQSPQFEKENAWMQLPDFQMIFFWEWLHRLLARFIGLAYALPLAWFWMKKQIPAGYKPKFLALVALVGVQGFVGWYMVSSGLIDRPAVSHYGLAAHLSLAFLLYALTLWYALTLKNTNTAPDKKLSRHTIITLGIFIATFIWGAFTAGLDAGLIYNETFPKMGTDFLPPELASPFTLKNFLETPPGVQFIHRWLAVITVLAILSLWIHALRRKKIFSALHALALMGILQAGLGIATLFSGVAVTLAVAHQSGALIILTLLIYILRKFKA